MGELPTTLRMGTARMEENKEMKKYEENIEKRNAVVKKKHLELN